MENGSDLLMTTDGYVVDPPFFPGGDIGRLSVFGTCNDLSVSGAARCACHWHWSSRKDFPSTICGGRFPPRRTRPARRESGSSPGIRRWCRGAKAAAYSSRQRAWDGGRFPFPSRRPRLRPGDAVIVSAPIGAHGLTVLAARESLPVAEALRSDMAFLYPAVSALFPLGDRLRFMRDATRGGVAAVLNEIVQSSPVGIVVEEAAFPVSDEVRTVSTSWASTRWRSPTKVCSSPWWQETPRKRRSTCCAPIRWAGTHAASAMFRRIVPARSSSGRGSAARGSWISRGDCFCRESVEVR